MLQYRVFVAVFYPLPQCTYSAVFISRVDQPFIDLITDTYHIVTSAEICHRLQLSPSEHLHKKIEVVIIYRPGHALYSWLYTNPCRGLSIS